MNRILFVDCFHKRPEQLEKFLTKENKRILSDYNLFYVLKSNMERSIFKIGISSGTHRLSSYLNIYGSNAVNQCSGVLLYYLTGTKKSPDFGIERSYARKKEKQLIADLKQFNVRGDERFEINEAQLRHAILDAEKRGFKTKAQQEAITASTLTPTDLVLKVLGHTLYKTKNKIRTLLLRWNRPSLDDVSYETEETVAKIKNLPTSTQAARKAWAYAKANNLQIDL